MYKLLSISRRVYRFLTSVTDFKIEKVNSPNSSSSSSSSSSCCCKRKRDTDSFDDGSPYKRPKYDLFLNYSYEDTGKGFVSHLKGALTREGFTISDHTTLPVCEHQSSVLSKAIEESGMYLVVLSRHYASSRQCLDELVSIMDRFKKRRVFPIFYNIEPTHVKGQKGPGFMEAFQTHTADMETIQKWKQALDDAALRSGLTLKNRDEEKFIREIVKELRMMQNPETLFHTKCPIGVESRAGDIISALRLNDHVFRIVAVLGISGSGKTTIVKAVYDRIAADFEYRCFIEDVYSYEDRWGRSWKFELQKDAISHLTSNPKSAIIGSHTNGAAKITKLITGRKVLLVLDGVDKFEHLKALAIHDASFSSLSRIIVTTTNKQSLVNLPCTPYDMRLFDRSESFELFAGLTFGKDDLVDKEFVEQVVSCAGGLPLVLDVWSRHFKCYERKHWRSILEMLKRIPHDDIQKKLQVSYDSLNNRAKKLFLDIACFFHGMDRDLVVKVLQDDASGFIPEVEIQHLINKGLVKIDLNNCLSLHKVIKEMGQEVVRKENEDEPGKRTRLMDRDVTRVLKDFSGTELVESIRGYVTSVHVQVEALKKMRNLRLIKDLPWLCDYFSYDDEMSPLYFKKLKYMEWKYFPYKSLDTIDMDNVVVLKLQHSKLEILCKGMKSLKKLNILDVSYSSSLTKTGNFTGLENLEELNLKKCRQLEELHGSINQLHKLREINVDGCVRLESIPNLLPSIEVINARDCTSVVNLPDSISLLHKLREINLYGCAKLESIPNLSPSIEVINACDCTSLVSLPSNMLELQYLNKLLLDGCLKLEPKSLKKVSSLFKDLFFTRGLIMSLSVAKLRHRCDFQNLNKGDVLSIVAPMNLNKKISGVMICFQDEGYDRKTIILEMFNKTKNQSCDLPWCSPTKGFVFVLFCPLGDRTLMVEAGDVVELKFYSHPGNHLLSGGLRFIYENDLLNHLLLIQNAYG